MKIGFIGLGKMGFNISLAMINKGHDVIGYDNNVQLTSKLEKNGIKSVSSLNELVKSLPNPKIIWLMLPSGYPTTNTLDTLINLLDKDSILIDAGNSHFKQSIEKFENFKKNHIHFLDCGTSGGIEGAKKGLVCMMIGGNKKAYDVIKPVIKDICAPNGYGYLGRSGSGHFAKMVHNGIEYGMMAAIAEGIQALKDSEFQLNLKEVSRVFSNGSIIESKLMYLVNKSLKNKNYFDQISGMVPKGETEDKMQYLVENANMAILKQAILMRVKTREKDSFAGKVISALRNQFGGHSLN